jgi:cellulose synthase/poly-beta-1,6-N-acetylglucosamine synthase-like glycosyltransferase
MFILSLLTLLVVLLANVTILSQAIYAIVGLFGKPLVFPDSPPKRYCLVVSARNEETVIANFLKDVWKQDYDTTKLEVWIVADNCTDNTAQVARDNGAHVVERFDTSQVGKGYALTYLFDVLFERDVVKDFDAFFIFDADNTLNSNYFSEMNKAFSYGFDVVTSYRNSRNFSSNWVSAGSALWFIRESRLLNNSRNIIGFNSHVGGTGFMFSRKILELNKGWKYHLMTEDLEFTMDSVINGYKIGYCGTAMFYDEQPVSFSQSWHQRLRWSKGFLQVFWHYAPALLKASIKDHNLSYLDLTLLMFPWMFVTLVRFLLGALYASLGFVSWASQFDSFIGMALGCLYGSIGLMTIAILTVFAERHKIGATNKELVAYCLSFPVFILSYVPISLVAIFSKTEWRPIEHTGEGSDNDLAS